MAARTYPSLVTVESHIPGVADNLRAWEVFEQWQKPFICCFSDGDPITRGGHFIQEDDPQNFARLAIEASLEG